MTTTSTPTARPRYNWEEEVTKDQSLQRINTYMERILAKMSGPAPPPRADAGRRGSRFQPAPPALAVKEEQRPSALPAADGSGSGGNDSGESTPQYIDYRDYQSESSELDMREVDPMDELSDFESDSQQSQRLEPVQEQEQPMDVEMDAADGDGGEEAVAEDEDEDEEDAEHTACEVCQSSEHEADIILCDDCDAEYHIFCLQPPLPKVPDGAWYCPKCSVNRPKAPLGAVPAPSAAVDVKQENVRAAAASADARGNGAATIDTDSAAAGATSTAGDAGNAPSGTDGSDPTAISIMQALEGNPESSNSLLVHACNCDEMQCKDPEFHVFCPCMKRFLRSVCWASHNEKWRTYAIARTTAEMFAYHAMHCQLPECNVPMCVKIREEEIV